MISSNPLCEKQSADFFRHKFIGQSVYLTLYYLITDATHTGFFPANLTIPIMVF